MRVALIAVVPLSLFHAACAGEPPRTEQKAEQPAVGRRVVRPDRFPADRPYSFGVLAGDTLYLAGQLGQDPVTGEQPNGIDAQTRQAMENVGHVLKAAGMDFANLVKCHVYLNDMDDYTRMNAVYGKFFMSRVPARTTVEADDLPGGASIEITCISYRDLSRISVVRVPQGALPAPLGPYSPGVWAGDTLYLSGMGGQFPKDRRLPKALAEQTKQTLVNIRTTLRAAGLRLSHLVDSHVYLTTPEEVEELTGAYDHSFASMPAPPQGLVLLPRLPGEIKTEITVVASRQTDDREAIPVADNAGGGTRGMRVGDTLYTRTESAPEAGAEFEHQLRGVLRKLERTLTGAGRGWRDVVHVEVYLANMADMDSLNRVFRETFPEQPPARTTIQAISRPGERVQAAIVATAAGL
ncbi:MAG: RidA family protein [Vicinamibacteraceae bacterium]